VQQDLKNQELKTKASMREDLEKQLPSNNKSRKKRSLNLVKKKWKKSLCPRTSRKSLINPKNHKKSPQLQRQVLLEQKK
jgi:hypothetical protein